MYWRAWIPDVCFSDLGARTPTASPRGVRPAGPCRSGPAPARPRSRRSAGPAATAEVEAASYRGAGTAAARRDRKRVVEGKSADLGGRRIIKNKKQFSA